MANKNRSIYVIAQQFYGNGTGTEIRVDEVDRFLRGYIDSSIMMSEDEKVDRRMIEIPGSDGIVVVYDQNQEDEYVNVEFPERYARDNEWYRESFGSDMKMDVSCEISEIGFKIHTCCFACRVDANGDLQGLQAGDGEVVMRCFEV